jgi:queuine tRNA-ribosyltransferase
MSKIFTTTKIIGKYSRTGVLHTRAGNVTTPTFMPDGTRGAVKSLTPEQVTSTGVEIVLANTYHLHLNPGEKSLKKLGGLHQFARREGPMLTDSGGFQVFSLGKHTKITEEGVHFTDPKTGDKHFISPEKSIQIQLDLGADMIVAFDHLIGLGESVSENDIKDAFDRTHRWLERCIVEFKKLTKTMKDSEKPLLFGVVQGGLNLELRKKSLDIIQNSEADGIAIGGLSVGETREEMATVLEALAPFYRKDKPRFLLGVGTPEDLRIAVENGIDMLDCVLPTRNARHGVVWGKNDTRIHLTNEKFKEDSGVIEIGCDCYACVNGFSKSFLRHQFKSGDPLAGTLASIHNLRYMMRLCESYRE